MPIAGGVDRLALHRGQRQRAGADNALRTIAAVAKSRGSQLGQGLRLAATAQDAGGLIKNKQRAGAAVHKLLCVFQRRPADGEQRGFTPTDGVEGQALGLVRRCRVSRCINLLQRCHDWAMTEETAFPVS